MDSVILSDLTQSGEPAWQAVPTITEQRGAQRLELESEVSFRNASGQRCNARLINASPDGIQIRCNVATAQMLHPGGGKICTQNAPILQAELDLPFGDRTATLSICARLTYLTTLYEEPRCVIGLHFLEPRPTAQRLIERFFGHGPSASLNARQRSRAWRINA